MSSLNVTVTGVFEYDIELVEDNPYNANKQDGATANRLVDGMDEIGDVIELPVVYVPVDPGSGERGTPRWISGHHRAKSWAELGNKKIKANTIEGWLSPTDEFNLVNNLNTVRGNVTLSALKRVIRTHDEVDVSKLNVFKFGLVKLTPSIKKAENTDAGRRIALRDIARKVSTTVAEVLLDNIDAGVVAFIVEDGGKPKLAACVKLSLTMSSTRRNVPAFKAAIAEALSEHLLEVDENGDNQNTEGGGE